MLAVSGTERLRVYNVSSEWNIKVESRVYVFRLETFLKTGHPWKHFR